MSLLRRRTIVTLGSAFAALVLLALSAGACAPVSSAPDPSSRTEPDAASEQAARDQALYETWRTVAPGEHPEYNQRASLVRRGQAVYLTYCAGCHGEAGDGKGPAAERLITKPRDFTSGVYKFRSTDSGSLPMEADLYRTISRGLSGVSMPAFPLMPERERVAVIEYLKIFYPRWEAEKGQRRIVEVPRAPDDLDDSRRALRGRLVYIEMQCAQCHGVDGRGTGATRTEYVDAWGDPQKPLNFTRGSLKGGNLPEDIYRTFHTGLRSIMPSYGGDTAALATVETYRTKQDTLSESERQRLETVLGDFPQTSAELFDEMTEAQRLELARRNSWDLVAYIVSLRTQTTTARAVLGQRAGDEGVAGP
jgi:cytochrome c oxidase cbb3-type subunit 2